jgi:FlaA1/EpsC-like NDP-sugar epimerase
MHRLTSTKKRPKTNIKINKKNSFWSFLVEVSLWCMFLMFVFIHFYNSFWTFLVEVSLCMFLLFLFIHFYNSFWSFFSRSKSVHVFNELKQ